MKTTIRAGSLVFVLLVLGVLRAFGAPPGATGAAVGEAKVFDAASANAKTVAALSAGDSFRVLETGAREERVSGRRGRWLRISTPDGIQGWLHGGWAVVSTSYLKPADFPDAEAYGRYLAWALQKGERVRAVQDYEKVAEGDLGWFHSMDDGDPPVLVVWDKDLDATPWVEALPEDFPRILSGRVYFVYPDIVEPLGEKSLADFPRLADQWAAGASYETLFPVGSRVILGEHEVLTKEDPDSRNWGEEMSEYVGLEATVTSHEGQDPWGRPVVAVDVDDGQFYWRTEDMELLERGTGEVADHGDEDYGDGDYSYEDYDDEYDDEYEGEYEGEYEDLGEDLAGMVGVGTKVILGRHDERNGGDNWAPEMDAFVGKQATVTEIIGSDDQGFLVVGVKENTWSWRIRNLAVVGRGVAGSYGFQAGDRVILGRHRFVDGNKNWNPSMDAFVGMSARITELVGTEGDGSECFLVRVDADQGEWVWRVESLTPVK